MQLPRPRRLAYAAALVLLLTVGLAAGLHNRATYRYLGVFQEVWRLARANYVEPVDEERLLEGAYKGMLGSLDAASAYLEKGDRALLERPPGPARCGLRVLPSGGIPVVVRVVPGGPADKAGLEAGDQIWRIDGRSTRLMPLPLVERLLSGRPGESRELVILDGSQFKRRTVTVTLEPPTGPGFTASEKAGPVLHLRIEDPDRVDAAALSEALTRYRTAHPGAPILVDVRGVVGLEASSLTRLAGVLLPGGRLLDLVPKEGDPRPIAAPEQGPVRLDPLFVLMDGTTAGVGEALAALLAERSGARLCGRTTYGLGGVPELIELRNHRWILLATREMTTPGGRRWAGEGLEPEKILTPEAGVEEIGGESDRLLGAALEWIRSGAAGDGERALAPAA
ncbi:MAG: PDZ domain-containing protein [Acidobacteria bacterium]|nr:MAG: PDZ domain-containing protein [Acidobacteriota bacterium]